MRVTYAILGWGIIALGIVHMAATPRTLTMPSLWFFSGGMVMLLTGALNVLNRRYGRIAPGVRWFCAASTAALTIFSLVAGLVSRASALELVIIAGWMAAATALSVVPRASFGQS